LRMGMSPSVGSLVPLSNKAWLHREGAGFSRGVALFESGTIQQAYGWPHTIKGSLPAQDHGSSRVLRNYNQRSRAPLPTNMPSWSTPHTNVYPFPPPIAHHEVGRRRAKDETRAFTTASVSVERGRAGPGCKRQAVARSASWSELRRAAAESERASSSSSSLYSQALQTRRAPTASANEKRASMRASEAADWAARASRPQLTVNEEVKNNLHLGVSVLYNEPVTWDARPHLTLSGIVI